MKPDKYLERAEVVMERVFAAPVHEVYRAWTDPSLMARWMWAGLGGEAWAECDLRVGGAYRVYTKCDGGRDQGAGWSGMCGLYALIVPNAKLVYTLHWDADVGYNQGERMALDEIVAVNFTGEGEGTRVSYTHLGIPDDGQSAGGHRAGTEAAFDLLADVLRG